MAHKFILVAGNTGSGKTVLCKRLSKDTGIRFVEVNQFTLGYPSRLIFESTGIGGRTRTVSDMYPTKLVIKCVLPHDIAIEKLKHSTKVFKPHEKRMNMSQIQFYYFCKEKVDALRCHIEYNYLTDDYHSVLKSVRSYVG